MFNFKRTKRRGELCSDTELDSVTVKFITVEHKHDIEQALRENADPGNRKAIHDWHPNVRDEIRLGFLQKGACQPRGHKFPQTTISSKPRRFVDSWFNEYDWLEYSIQKDAAFCLPCYHFKPQNGDQVGGETFISVGYRNWKKKNGFKDHVGDVNSAHNLARQRCDDLKHQKRSITACVVNQSTKEKMDYQHRLNSSVDCARFLLHQGLPFRGHDESKESPNQGNFLQLLKFLANHNETIKNVVLNEAPGNLKLTSPDIQKDITRATAEEITSMIIQDLGDSFFSVMVDESRDVSVKEQIAVVLRYVDKKGRIIERFLGIQHVADTIAATLKASLDELFSFHKLSTSRLRGQGYDGASNMQGEFSGLLTRIENENPYAFYIHCFAHQLQLALVGATKKNRDVMDFFNYVLSIVNVVGASCKRKDILLQKHYDNIVEMLNRGEITSGRGLNQEMNLRRHGDTRWGSHYITLVRTICMFSAIVESLEIVSEDATKYEQRTEARGLLEKMCSFEFIFNLHLMKRILGVTNELSQALQQKDQDIDNAMRLVVISKDRLQNMQGDGEWNALWLELKELNDRFNGSNVELLLCLASLSPRESFIAFDKEKLIRYANFYKNEFSDFDLIVLDDQLETYIMDVRTNVEFSSLKGIANLAEKMVETKKNLVYPLVYMLITLALTLPVATASVERVFSAMNIVKTRLRNRIGDKWMNDSLIVYIEKELLDQVSNEAIMQRFQHMKPRKQQLP